MLGYVNRTHAVLNHSWDTYKTLFHFEVVLIIFSMISIGFWFYVILTAKNMHPNVRRLNAFYYGQYLIQLGFWILQPIIILNEALDG
uniref:7TM_GPCR_Srx domain-containing protein n=1 Tax=Caenorhabditis tropicalis TaxID=1561998 RepID=A0A1I7TY53_9PELO